MRTQIGSILLLLVILLFVPSAVYSEKTSQPSATETTINKTEVNKEAPGKGQNAQQLNGITQAAAKSGVVKCLKRIDQLAGFLTKNTQSGAFMFLPSTDVDDHITSTSLEVLQSGNVISYSSITTAPVGTDGCGGLYEAVTYWKNSCDDVASKGFPGTKRAGAIKRHIQILDGGSTMRIFLMPADQGCISIKKEVVF